MRPTLEVHNLDTLISSADAGGYDLPADVLDAYDAYVRVRQIDVAEPDVLNLDTAAAQVLTDGDPMDLARTLVHGEQEVETTRRARHLLDYATERAGAEAAERAGDQADDIVREHLRPALERLYDEARKVAATLDSLDIRDTHALVTASPKVRAAYTALPALANRRSVILAAKRLVQQLGGTGAKLDERGLFSELERPVQTFVPDWKPIMKLPPFFGPEDPIERLIWLVTEGSAAGLWLPTGAEQDAAWTALFGPDMEQRANRARDAQAIAGMLG